MNNLIEEAARLQDFVRQSDLEFYFIGGLALQVWGEPRLTLDIDLTIFTNLSDEPSIINKFLKQYRPKFVDAAEFALTNRVLPMMTDSGHGIDLLLAGLSDMSEPLRRASYQQFTEGIELRICSPEDLIIMKTVAARSRDWADIEAVIIKQQELEWEYIENTLGSLTDFDESLLMKLRDLRNCEI